MSCVRLKKFMNVSTLNSLDCVGIKLCACVDLIYFEIFSTSALSITFQNQQFFNKIFQHQRIKTNCFQNKTFKKYFQTVLCARNNFKLRKCALSRTAAVQLAHVYFTSA